MTKKRLGSASRGMVDVEPGEGGEAPMTETGTDTGTTDIWSGTEEYDYSGSGDGGATTGASTLQLEVNILSAAAVDRIAQEIAARTAAKATASKLRTVIVAHPSVIASIRLHSAIEAEVASLETVIERLRADAGAETTVEVSDAAALVAPVVAAAATALPAIVNKAARVLRTVTATTAYSGRATRVRQVLLDAALAKHLSLKSIKVDIPERSIPTGESNGLVTRILKLQASCRQLERGGLDSLDLEPLTASVDALVTALFGEGEEKRPEPSMAQQLIIAENIVRGARKGAALLFAEIVFSGGSYRTRRWLFNILLGRDGLTYNGGAGVTYFLFRGDERTVLDSDTIYFASPHARFRETGVTSFQPTNISSRGG